MHDVLNAFTSADAALVVIDCAGDELHVFKALQEAGVAGTAHQSAHFGARLTQLLGNVRAQKSRSACD
jgi:hypothetical protein